MDADEEAHLSPCMVQPSNKLMSSCVSIREIFYWYT